MKYSFKCIRTIEELDNIKDALMVYVDNREEPRVVQQDIEFFKYQIKEDLLEGKPLICVLYKDDSPVMVSFGEEELVEMSPAIAYFKLRVFNFKKRCYHIFPYSVFGGNGTLEHSKIFIEMLLDNLRKEDIDYVFFSLLRRKAALSSNLLDIKNPLIRDFTPSNEKHFILKVPESLETFLSTKDKQGRQKLKKIVKKVESEYKGRHLVRVFVSEEDVDRFYEDAEKVAQKSQLRAINVGFRSTKKELMKKKWIAKKGYFRSYILYLNNIPVSFMEGVNYRRHFVGENTGFDMEYEKFQTGSYIKLKLIEDIAQTKCADFIDFQIGADRWKQNFSSQEDEEIRVKIYLPKFSNIFFKVTFTVFPYLNRLVRRLLKKTMLYEKTRKFIRSIFVKKNIE